MGEFLCEVKFGPILKMGALVDTITPALLWMYASVHKLNITDYLHTFLKKEHG